MFPSWTTKLRVQKVNRRLACVSAFLEVFIDQRLKHCLTIGSYALKRASRGLLPYQIVGLLVLGTRGTRSRLRALNDNLPVAMKLLLDQDVPSIWDGSGVLRMSYPPWSQLPCPSGAPPIQAFVNIPVFLIFETTTRSF